MKILAGERPYCDLIDDPRQMKRRGFAKLVGSVALWPFTARAQKMSVIGILSPAPDAETPVFKAFRARLRELGYVEKNSVRLDFRLARGQPEAIPSLATELVKSNPDVILGDGALIVRTLRDLTTTVPVVGILGVDPVAGGLVTSLSRPGGNVTGVATFGTDLNVKRIELLREAIPRLSRLAVLWDRNNDTRGQMLDTLSDHARRTGLTMDVLEGGRVDALAKALARDRLAGADAVLISSGPTHYNNRQEIVRHIAASIRPAIYPEREYVTDGGLMSYGPNVSDVFRRLAEHADRILKGAKPGDIPVEQVARVEYVVNLKTARSLSLTIPPAMLARADEVIE
jgi:putative ABC transport system substrate-binding protein